MLRLVLVAACVAVVLAQVPPSSDSFVVRTLTIDLDLPASERWNASYFVPYNATIQTILEQMFYFIPAEARKPIQDGINDLASHLEDALGEYGDEMIGVANAVGADIGDIILLNLMYEISPECTSIVSTTPTGDLFHARNLDFGWGFNFTDMLRDLVVKVEFTQNKTIVYQGVTFIGYVGLLTGMRENAFSTTINARAAVDVVENLLLILSTKAYPIGLLIRDNLLANMTYNQAVDSFTKAELPTSVYIIVGGVSGNQGVVLTRNRTETVNTWTLNAPSAWYLAQTNYDHWLPDPWYDPRRTAADNALNKIGQDGLTIASLYSVESTKPVLNHLTTYTAVMHVANNTLIVYSRICPAPCPYV